MTKRHDNIDKRVSEPVQVYLDPGQRRKLDQLAVNLGLTKSDVVRQALEALERQMSDPAEHPALRIIGIVISSSPDYQESAITDWLDKFDDQDFSFTDAVSFAVMSDRGIREALAIDHHFTVAGFTVVP